MDSVLTATEFAVLWEVLGLGAPPVALRLPSPGSGERRGVVAGRQALRERGLADPAGPDPGLAHLLRLLARPSGQLELRGSWDHEVRALAAGRAGAGALAVRRDSTVTLTPCGALPAALLAVLPPARPGRGHPTAVPATSVVGRASIVALAADRWGVARRCGGSVTVIDTAGGRYLLGRGVGEHDDERTALEPADRRTLHDSVAALLAGAAFVAAPG